MLKNLSKYPNETELHEGRQRKGVLDTIEEILATEQYPAFRKYSSDIDRKIAELTVSDVNKLPPTSI